MRARLLFTLALGSTLAACAPGGGDSGDEQTDDDSVGITKCAPGAVTKGVDVSYYQGNINWTKVKASGVGFAIARTSDGTGFKDPKFAQNWAGMKSAGLVRGVYQFFRPNQDPVAQANLMIQMINEAGGLEDGDLAPTLDLEVTGGMSTATIIARSKVWLEKVEAATGRVPLVYTSPGFFSQFGSPQAFGHYTLWVAHWGPQCPNVPSPWGNWHFWQYADDGTVPGIQGAVDLDYFNGSLQDLKAFAGGKPNGGGSDLPTLGGDVASRPALGKNADGRLEVFARGAGGDVVTTFQTQPNGGWSPWYSLGGSIAGVPAVGVNADGRLEVFARGTDHAIWHAWQAGPNGKIGGFVSMDGAVDEDPVVASNSDGRLEVFVAGGDGWIYHAWQTQPNGGFSGWATLATKVTGGLVDPRPIRRANGKLVVVAKGIGDQSVYISEQGSGDWTAWKPLGGALKSPPVIGVNADGRVEVFGRGTDDALWHTWETAPGAGFSGWISEGGVIEAPSLGRDTDGRLNIFVKGSDGALYRNRQVKPNGGWTGWAGMGGQLVSGPVAANNQDGRLEVFFRASGDEVEHVWQSSPGVW